MYNNLESNSKHLKICKKCIQPNTRPGVFFDENQICGACLWYEEKNLWIGIHVNTN